MRILKINLLTIIFAVISAPAFAQDDKHENHMKEVPPVENDNFKVEFSNVHCQTGFAQGKMKISNQTPNYLVFNQSDIKGNFDFGTLENEKGKEIFIDPYDNVTRNFKFTGEAMHVDRFSIDVSAFFIVNIQGKIQEGEEFSIPPKSNDVTIGNFSCSFDKMTRKTDKLNTTFKCRYNGNKVGIVDETKAAFIYPNGNEFANAQNKQKLMVMERGDEKKFDFNCSEHKSDGDLQFIDMKIKWNDTFKESEKMPLESFHIDFELDEVKTIESNK